MESERLIYRVRDEVRGLHPHAKWVLSCLAMNSQDGQTVEMEQTNLAIETGYYWPTVKRHLQVLEQRGLIIPMRSGHKIIKYRFSLPGVGES